MSRQEELRYTSAPGRRDVLVRHVEEQGYCTISELSDLLGVSEMTVRRDVSRLVAEDRVRSFHGGVSAVGQLELTGSDYAHRADTLGATKWNLATRALELIGPDAVIALDAGTTIAALAHQLPENGKIRVVTASLPAISALASNPGVEVTALGGVLHTESLSFAGPTTLSAIQNLHVETLFLAASGLSERGVYCGNDFDALTKRSLIETADRVVLVADSSKFAAAAMAKVCGWDVIDAIIVDDQLSPTARELILSHGIELVSVETSDPIVAL